MSSPYFFRASLLTFSSTTMQSVICRAFSRRMISSSFSFALGRLTEVESRKPTSPNVRVMLLLLPMSERCSLTYSFSSCSSRAIASLYGLLCSSATFLAPTICFCISLSISPRAIWASAICLSASFTSSQLLRLGASITLFLAMFLFLSCVCYGFAVIQDITLAQQHIKSQWPNEYGGGRVPVLRRCSARGHEDDQGRDRHQDRAHEPLFYHFHCPCPH